MFGSVAAAVYRSAVSGDVPAGDAEGSLEGAAAVAGQLPDSAAAQLMDTARNAFDGSVTAISWLGAALVAGLAVVALTALRKVRPSNQTE